MRTEATAYKFCPVCGKGRLGRYRGPHRQCARCGFLLFLNPRASVTLLATDDRGDLLLVRRKREPYRGLWATPGGFIEPGESAEAALRREIREELGIVLGPLTLFAAYPTRYPFQGIHRHTLDISFTGQPAGGIKKLVPRDDISGAKFFAPKRIPYTRLAFSSQRRAIREYLRLSLEHKKRRP